MAASMEAVFSKALETSAEEFVHLVGQHHSRANKFVLKSVLSKCSLQSAARFCEALASTTNVALDAFRKLQEEMENVGPNPSPVDDEAALLSKRGARSRRGQGTTRSSTRSGYDDRSGNESSETARNSSLQLERQCRQVLKTLHSCILVVNIGLTDATDVMQSRWLFPTVLSLHDALVLLEVDPNLQESIAALCELWWREKLEGKESLIVQCLPFVLSKALTWGRKKDIQRVYSMRNALTLLDFLDHSIEDTRHLLMRTVVTPVFLRTQHGRRFISFLFGLNPHLVKELVIIVRSQIPFGRKSILEAYGETLYQAWKAAEGACLQEIEYSCIQGLLEGALYASSKALGASVRTVLEGFAAQKAQDGVESMLFRLLEPLLFRALQVANANVRQNALLLFVTVFPLEDPGGSKEEKEALLEKQLSLLEKLVMDPSPDVRTVAIEVVCRILRLFWEIVPSRITVKLLTKIVDEMTYDSTSNLVRLAVLQGVTYLLENAESHELLRAILPHLAHLLNDNCMTVRVAVAELLLAIKGIRIIQFYKVIRMDSLLSSLASDNSLVAQHLTKLLLPSYFPSQVPVKEACKRCIVLLRRSPQAGAQFCKWLLAEGASAISLLKLIKVLSSLATENDTLTDEVRTGVILAILGICESLVTLEEWKEATGKILTGDMLAALIARAPDAVARSYVLQIASRLPPKDVSKPVSYCGDLVMKCPVTPADVAELGAVHALLLAWGGLEHLLESLLDLISGFCNVAGIGTSWFGRGRDTSSQDSGLSKQLEGRREIAKHKFDAAAGGAWHLETLLSGDETRLAVLRSPHIKKLLQTFKKLAKISTEFIGEGSDVIASTSYPSSPILAFMKLYHHIVVEVSEGMQQVLEKSSKGQRKSLDRSLGALGDISGGFEAAWEEWVGWVRDMLAKATGSQLPVTSLPQSQTKAKHTPCYDHKQRHRQLLSALSRNIVPGARSKLNNYQIAAVLASTLQTTADSFTLGLIKSISGRQVTANLVADSVQWFIQTFSSEQGNEDDLRQGLKSYHTSARVIMSYAAKFLHLYIKDSSNGMEDGCRLANDLLDSIAALESHEGPTSPILPVKAIFEQWIPDLLISVSSSIGKFQHGNELEEQTDSVSGWQAEGGRSTSEESAGCSGQFRPWMYYLAGCTYEAMLLIEPSLATREWPGETCSGECLENPIKRPLYLFSNTNVPMDGMDLLDTIRKFLMKGNVRVLRDFIHLLIRFALFSTAQRDYCTSMGAVDLICRRLLVCQGPEREDIPFVLKESLAGLKELSSHVNAALESLSQSENCVCGQQELEIADSILRATISRHRDDAFS